MTNEELIAKVQDQEKMINELVTTINRLTRIVASHHEALLHVQVEKDKDWLKKPIPPLSYN